MWFSKGAKVKYSVYYTKNCCGNNLQNKSCTNNHNYCRKDRKFIKLSVKHNRKYQAQNCEKLLPIAGKIGTFLKHHSYCYTNSVNCYYAKKHNKDNN